VRICLITQHAKKHYVDLVLCCVGQCGRNTASDTTWCFVAQTLFGGKTLLKLKKIKKLFYTKTNLMLDFLGEKTGEEKVFVNLKLLSNQLHLLKLISNHSPKQRVITVAKKVKDSILRAI
jgi:hypothetical protein